MNTKKTEILAPAGGMESVYAAVRSGADAVYMGAENFSARSSAQNFTKEELKSAIDYCHLHGVKTYLTLNTLIFDTEMQEALDLSVRAYNLGIDALIIQDLGLASILKNELPEIPLHGSTQMSVHTPEGAKLLQDLGFKRVVLSRELSLKEIKEIKEHTDIELEVFIHGALCMCVSGQCYFSAMLGGRSGNRGKCAQPCRLPFKLKGGSDYALSLKDLSLMDHIGELEKIGVHSLKIEGRMKRPEYVAAATKAAKNMRDEGFIDEETRFELEGVFSRTGFTDAYLLGKRSRDMFGFRRKEDVLCAQNKLFSKIAQGYKDETSHIPVDMIFEARLLEPPLLTVTQGSLTVNVKGETSAEKAEKIALSEEKCRELLSKTGGTPYFLNTLNTHIEDNISLPAKELNALRRRALSALSGLRCETNRAKLTAPIYQVEKARSPESTKKRRARFADSDIPSEFKDFDLVFVPLFTKEDTLRELTAQGFNLGVEIPRGMFGKETKIKEALKRAKALGITHVLLGNLGGIYPAKQEGFTLHGDFGLNVTNTASVNFLEELGFEDIILSFELTATEINSLGGKLKRGIIDRGYLPLMLTRACPGLQKKGGCTSCNKQEFLQDRKGESFIYCCDGICTEILNCVPLSLNDKLETFTALDFHMSRFSVENSVEKVENTSDFSRNNLKNYNFTRGLYFRGVK